MNTFTSKFAESPRWGTIKVKGKVVYEGQMDRCINSMYNATVPAAELRIISRFVTWDELATLLTKQLDKEMNEISTKFNIHKKDFESEQSDRSPSQISKPALTLIRNSVDS
jgi:hypothetical protein